MLVSPLGLASPLLAPGGPALRGARGPEYRYSEGQPERLPSLAADLVRLNVDPIVAWAAPEAGAAGRATSTIPIVFLVHGDPVGGGQVANLARPAGNMTGLGQMLPELAAKQVELCPRLLRRSASGSCGVPRLSLAGYVTVTGATRGVPAAGGR